MTVLYSQRELMVAALKYPGCSANDTDETHWRRTRDLIIRAKPYWTAFNASSYIEELTVGNIWLAHGYSGDMFQARQYIVATNQAVFPPPAVLRRLEMLNDLDRTQRRVLSRIWTEIKVR